MVTPQEVEALAKVARRLGLKRLRVGDVEMELGDLPTPKPRAPRKPKPAPPPAEPSAEEDDPLYDAV